MRLAEHLSWSGGALNAAWFMVAGEENTVAILEPILGDLAVRCGFIHLSSIGVQLGIGYPRCKPCLDR